MGKEAPRLVRLAGCCQTHPVLGLLRPSHRQRGEGNSTPWTEHRQNRRPPALGTRAASASLPHLVLVSTGHPTDQPEEEEEAQACLLWVQARSARQL